MRNEVLLRIDIESAMRLRNPSSDFEAPNAFVVLNLTRLSCNPSVIQTHIVQKSSYPAWHLINQQVKFSLNNENLRYILDFPLEFEIYHH